MIRLRPFKISDADYLIEWVKEERIFSMWCANKFEYPLSVEQIIEYKELYDKDEFGWSFTALNEEGTPVGHLLMRKADYENQSVHLGFVVLDENYRGKGYGKAMLCQALKYAFDILGVDKVTLGVFANNPAAHHCYLAAGFEDVKYYEGLFPYKDEKWGLYDMQAVKKKITKGYPDDAAAEQELILAGNLNPGPWVEHSMNTGRAAKYIAERCEGLDPQKAYVLGLLHDIGRRVGIVSQRHILEGYRYCMKQGWEDAARICMTHSFMVQDIVADVGEWDVSDEDYKFVKHYINTVIYDDYDKLFQLCDSLAQANGFCILEKRFVDVHRRYGVGEYTVARWNAVFEIKEYFEKWMGCSVYDVLPKVKETTFQNTPLWKPPVTTA